MNRLAAASEANEDIYGFDNHFFDISEEEAQWGTYFFCDPTKCSGT